MTHAASIPTVKALLPFLLAKKASWAKAEREAGFADFLISCKPNVCFALAGKNRFRVRVEQGLHPRDQEYPSPALSSWSQEANDQRKINPLPNTF